MIEEISVISLQQMSRQEDYNIRFFVMAAFDGFSNEKTMEWMNDDEWQTGVEIRDYI